MDLLYECAVCHLPLDRARIHYGGLSCYSCRAFFRRKTQKHDLAKCQLKQECKISYIERKSCPPCRYEKCLRAGMRTDFVLNDDEKNKRFQKSLRKTNQESDDEDNDFEIVEVVKTGGKRILPDQQKDKKRKRDTKPGPSKIKPAPNYKPRTCSLETFSVSDSESDDGINHLWPVPIADEVKESKSEPTEQWFLDPETGLLVEPANNEGGKAMNFDSMEIRNSDLTQPYDKVKPYPAYTYADSATSSTSTPTIVDSSNSLPQKARRKRIFKTDENQILKYVHKKFGVAAVKETSLFVDGGQALSSKEDNGIQNTILHYHNDKHQHPHEHIHEHLHSPCQPRQE